MIAPEEGDGKNFIARQNGQKNAEKSRRFDHELVNRTIITPNFGQVRVTLGADNCGVASKARSGMSAGFLSPPAPRGSADRAC
jgi:hypothetical protein